MIVTSPSVARAATSNRVTPQSVNHVTNNHNNSSLPSPGIEQMVIAGGEAIDRHMEEIRNIGTNNSRISALTGPVSAHKYNPLEWDLHLPPSKMISYHSLSKNKRQDIHSMVSRYARNKVATPSLDDVVDYFDNMMLRISSPGDNASVASIIISVNVPGPASVKQE